MLDLHGTPPFNLENHAATSSACLTLCTGGLYFGQVLSNMAVGPSSYVRSNSEATTIPATRSELDLALGRVTSPSPYQVVVK